MVRKLVLPGIAFVALLGSLNFEALDAKTYVPLGNSPGGSAVVPKAVAPNLPATAVAAPPPSSTHHSSGNAYDPTPNGPDVPDPPPPPPGPTGPPASANGAPGTYGLVSTRPDYDYRDNRLDFSPLPPSASSVQTGLSIGIGLPSGTRYVPVGEF